MFFGERGQDAERLRRRKLTHRDRRLLVPSIDEYAEPVEQRLLLAAQKVIAP